MADSRLVVLVEDSPTQAKAIQMYLSHHGVEVMICGDGPEGIRAVDQYHPSAVILDVNLPTMSGYQIARHIKRNRATSEVPIIMLTKNTETTSVVEGLNSGADHYIRKGPEAAEDLWKTLCAFGIIEWR